MRTLIAGMLLSISSSAALGQTLACNPSAPRSDPGTGFAPFGANEQALARGGNAGPAWEWALGTDTTLGQKVQGSVDWISGHTYGWALNYSGAGAATLEIRDGAALVLSLAYPSGMDAGNALQLQVATNAGVGPNTTMAAAISSIKGQAVSGSLAQTGSNLDSSQALYFYYPPMNQGFTAQGSVTLSYATLPTGSRVEFNVKAGVLPCTNKSPTVALSTPASGSLLQAGSAATLSATAQDSDGTITRVEFFANGVSIGSATSAPYSVPWTPTGGSYNLTAKATDNAGDSTTSSAVTVTVNAQPSVSLTSPTSGTIVQAPGSVTLSANAGDSDGAITKVDFYRGATLLGTATTSPYILALTNLTPGSYSFTAVATDDRGGTTTSAPVSFIVNARPTVSLTSPGSNATFTAPARITVSAQAADSDGNVSSVAFYYGTTLITTLTSAPYSFVWTDVPAGAYSLTATVTDNAGAIVTSAPVTATVNAGVANIYYIHVDHLNTPRLIADAQQRTVWQWDQQEPFGDNPPDEGAGANGVAFESFFPLRFPGQYFDKETNLHYNNLRDYDPNLGSYKQSDLIGVRGGLNTYTYVDGNSLDSADPTGLIKWSGVVSIAFLDLTKNRSRYSAGYHRGQWVLVSECLRDQRWRVTVDESGYGVGIGVNLIGKLEGGSTTTTLDDGLDYINPYVFNGVFEALSAGTPLYTAYSKYTLGNALGNWTGWSLSTAFGAAVLTGNSHVTSAMPEPCGCKP